MPVTTRAGPDRRQQAETPSGFFTGLGEVKNLGNHPLPARHIRHELDQKRSSQDLTQALQYAMWEPQAVV